MADSNKSPIGGTLENINESVVKPVVDEVGKMLEIGAQSVLPTQTQPSDTNHQNQTSNPSDVSTTQLEEQKKISDIQFYIKRQKEIGDAVDKARKEREQREAQSVQNDQQEQKIKQFEVTKKQQKNIALEQAQKRTEVKGGIGG